MSVGNGLVDDVDRTEIAVFSISIISAPGNETQ